MSRHEKKLITHRLAFFIMVFMANMACVEDLFNQGTCDWICAADTDIDKESSEMMVQGRLVKLKVLYEEQVDRECANQTDVTNSSTSASLWLKMASDTPRKKLHGRLQFSTLTIIEGFLSGQFPFGGYKEMNVSCTFKSTSIKKSATEYSSRRLTFVTPHSTLYYVEHLANYTKSNTTFLTLLRTENITRLSVGVTGANGSLASANFASDNELTVSDGWLKVAVIIWIVFLLYSPAIFILFRPSEVTLQIVRKRRKTLRKYRPSNVQVTESTEDDSGHGSIHESGNPIEGEDSNLFIHESGTPIEGEDLDSEVSPHGGDDLLSGSRLDAREGSGAEVPSLALEESKKPTEQESEMVVALPPKYKVHEHRKIPSRIGDRDDLLQDLDNTNDHDSPALDSGFAATATYATRPTCSDKSSTSDRTSDSVVISRKDKELNVSNNSAEELNGSNINEEELTASLANRNDKKLNGSIWNDEELNASDRNDVEQVLSAHSNNSVEEVSGLNKNDGTKFHSSHIIDLSDDSRQTSEDAEQQSSVQSLHEEDETEYIPLVIVGETYPIGVGSFIGNKLFSSTNRNKLCNVVKLIFIFIVPLLFFTGLGDFFLVHLPNLHSRMAKHLPSSFLTSSVVKGAITNHPMVLFLVLFSAICYVIRLYFVCFCGSNTLKTALEPCSVHRMHPTCFTYKLLQWFFIRVSPPPKSICSFNSSRRRQHLKCAVCYWFYKTCLSYKPCGHCNKPAPPECSKYLDLPQNILHNLEKLPDIIIKYWDSFFECVSKLGEKENIVTVIFSPLAVVPLIIDIFFSSPLVCLCYGRLWMLNERYKNKFRGSKFMLPTLEFLLIFFSLVWVIFFLFSSAVPLGVAIVGIIRVLSTHTYKVLPHLGIAVIAVHYFWSCYRSFTTPYRQLAKTLASSYQKKFDEQEKMPGISLLIHYKQGEQGNRIKVIPKELFNDGCKDLNLPIRNKVASLICKLGLTLLVFLFVFPIISTDDVDPLHTTTVITFFAVAYNNINDAINGDKFEVSQEDADEVVDNYIRRKQESS